MIQAQLTEEGSVSFADIEFHHALVELAFAQLLTKFFTGAVLGIVLFVNLPIVWKSVEWWRGSLHPRSVTMTGEMRQTLLLSMAAWILFFAVVLWERLRLEMLQNAAEAAVREDYAGAAARREGIAR